MARTAEKAQSIIHPASSPTVCCVLCIHHTVLKLLPPLKLLMLLVFTSVFQEVLILLVLLASFPHVPHLTPLDKAGYLVPFFFSLSLLFLLFLF